MQKRSEMDLLDYTLNQPGSESAWMAFMSAASVMSQLRRDSAFDVFCQGKFVGTGEEVLAKGIDVLLARLDAE